MIGDIAKNAGRTLKHNSPAILTGLGIAGSVTASILAVKATPEALRRVWDAESEQTTPLTTLEKARLTWTLYVPAGLTLLATGACILGANQVNSRRTAMAIGAYTVSETAYKEYKDATQRQFGDKGVAKIQDDVASVRLEGAPSTNVVISSGKELCFESTTGRYFESDMETIRKAQNDVNMRCINDMYCSLNDFFRMIGLPPVDLGEEMGFNTDNPLDIRFTAVLKDGKPCIHIGYTNEPKFNYHKIW